MLHAILIINKSGGLIYQKEFGNGIAKLSSNEYLILAGTLHGIHAITCLPLLTQASSPRFPNHPESS